MKRRFSIPVLAGIGAAILYAAAPGARAPAPAPADHAAADRYVERLSETLPPHPANASAKETPEDPELAKAAGRLDRAEPVLGAAFNVVR